MNNLKNEWMVEGDKGVHAYQSIECDGLANMDYLHCLIDGITQRLERTQGFLTKDATNVNLKSSEMWLNSAMQN